jgi:hypothetical protein
MDLALSGIAVLKFSIFMVLFVNSYVLFTVCIYMFRMIIKITIISLFSTDQLVFADERQYAVGTEL